MKLRAFKVGKSDASVRPPFVNPAFYTFKQVILHATTIPLLLCSGKVQLN